MSVILAHRRLSINLVLYLFLASIASITLFLLHFSKDACYEYVARLVVILLFILLGTILLVGAEDLVFAFLAIELQSLGLYILVALRRSSNISLEGALKYFILGSLASSLLALGFSLIYAFTGTTDIAKLAMLFSNTPRDELLLAPAIGIVLFMAGLFFKMGIAPFHF